ncbi:MAG: hypothetical protein LHW64_01235 [Candidatus Cloacimonetes bacterium]|nr:hypothetical protein [Candidatus Cloacimonadota bacterium]MCB5286408.1 hypothetical protein [Candidatus Cloacimonadota bacterium]MCK9184245.1 hypothetical protein [Candidatus Cloacimonadota bacterium]MCK9583391.1 hypothetical protein [Candidatus Cloacimonadota bacterium]MDY0228730.1 hypothetical protein [Candidatus Cloacimonadaceae bacterium]
MPKRNASGEGVLQDYEEAFFWCLASFINGYEDAEEALDVVSAKLSPKQREQIQARVLAWLYEHY